MALAFCPPRALLTRLENASGKRVRFHYPELVASTPTTNRRIPVFVTVDDAPTAHTHHILKALADCGDGKALFFVIGEYAQHNPEALRAIVRAIAWAITTVPTT